MRTKNISFLYLVVFLVVSFLLQACTTAKIKFNNQQTGKLLDTQFTKVMVHGNMVGELHRLFDSIHIYTSHKKASYGFEVENKSRTQGFLLDRDVDDLERYNAFVHLRLKNVSLRQVLDAMTYQAGWDYYIAPQEIMFVVGRNVTHKPHIQSSWAGQIKN